MQKCIFFIVTFEPDIKSLVHKDKYDLFNQHFAFYHFLLELETL